MGKRLEQVLQKKAHELCKWLINTWNCIHFCESLEKCTLKSQENTTTRWPEWLKLKGLKIPRIVVNEVVNLSSSRWINKFWYIHKMEYHAVIKWRNYGYMQQHGWITRTFSWLREIRQKNNTYNTNLLIWSSTRIH